MSAVLHTAAFLAGTWMVYVALASAARTFVLPRAAPDTLTRLLFLGLRNILRLILRRTRSYRRSDHILAWYAPVGLLLLVPFLYLIVLLGYTAMFWAIGAESFYLAFRDSGSSLFTLGFETVTGLPYTLLAFSEAMIGLVLVALLIAYLPTIYAAFSRREAAVTLLEVRAGSPPSAEQMILRYHRLRGLDGLSVEWERWETWFAELQESHTSLAMLVFLRSPQPNHSWVTAAGAVLDTASVSLAVIDRPPDMAAALCIRGGYLALRAIADYFGFVYNPNPAPNDPISVSRVEFDALLEHLEREKVPLKPDRDQAWRDFNGWRVNYDTVLLKLASLTSAPPAPWSSDRVEHGFFNLPAFREE